ncbi:MAG TPA: hypothetical protein VF510_13180 [Ktedonobacterales bacterium]
MTLRLRVGALAIGATLLLLVALVPAALAAPQAAPNAGALTLTSPVTGTLANGGTFAGTLNITQFVNQGGNLAAVGTLSGTLTNAAGAIIGTVTNVPVTAPVAAASGSCQILNLTLGPLDLNLLGLMVHLNQVVLNITAQSGAGNLLGNLLCAVANLLNGGAPLGALAGLLNNLLRNL